MNYADMLYKSSPEYLMAYKEGFDNGRDFAVSEMLSTIRKVSKTEGISETTGTVEGL